MCHTQGWPQHFKKLHYFPNKEEEEGEEEEEEEEEEDLPL